MSSNNVQSELQNIMSRIKSFWGNNVSNLNIVKITDRPFDMFTLSMNLYGKYDVLVEYDRSTLGFSVKKNCEYVVLSRLSKYPIYRGFDSYSTESNIMHNFQALDDVLRSM